MLTLQRQEGRWIQSLFREKKSFEVEKKSNFSPCGDMSRLTYSITSRNSSLRRYLMPSRRQPICPVTYGQNMHCFQHKLDEKQILNTFFSSTYHVWNAIISTCHLCFTWMARNKVYIIGSTFNNVNLTIKHISLFFLFPYTLVVRCERISGIKPI